jgi:TolA-binding protein
VYPEPRVTAFISEHFEPVRLHVKKHPEAMGRFGANWTPTVLIDDGDGKEYYRVEGYLPANDFLAQLKLGYAHYLFKSGNFAEAEKAFREVVDELPNTDAAPEALYWAGVSKYKATGDASALGATAQAFKSRYIDTPWAKKASIWG